MNFRVLGSSLVAGVSLVALVSYLDRASYDDALYDGLTVEEQRLVMSLSGLIRSDEMAPVPLEPRDFSALGDDHGGQSHLAPLEDPATNEEFPGADGAGMDDSEEADEEDHPPSATYSDEEEDVVEVEAPDEASETVLEFVPPGAPEEPVEDALDAIAAAPLVPVFQVEPEFDPVADAAAEVEEVPDAPELVVAASNAEADEAVQAIADIDALPTAEVLLPAWTSDEVVEEVASSAGRTEGTAEEVLIADLTSPDLAEPALPEVIQAEEFVEPGLSSRDLVVLIDHVTGYPFHGIRPENGRALFEVPYAMDPPGDMSFSPYEGSAHKPLDYPGWCVTIVGYGKDGGLPHYWVHEGADLKLEGRVGEISAEMGSGRILSDFVEEEILEEGEFLELRVACFDGYWDGGDPLRHSSLYRVLSGKDAGPATVLRSLL